MALSPVIPVGYQNLGNGKFFTVIEVDKKKYQLVVDPKTKQRWMYEYNVFGNGDPLFSTIDGVKFQGYNSTTISNSELTKLKNTLTTSTSWVNTDIQTAPPFIIPGAQGNGKTQTDPGPNSPGAQDTNISEFSGVLDNLQKEQKPNSYGNWFYPKTMNSQQDRIYIEQIKYVIPDIATAGEALLGALSDRENQFAEGTKEKRLGSVTLPISNKITESVEVGWGESKLSSIAAALMAGGTDAAFKLSEGDFLGGGGTAIQALQDVITSKGVVKRAQQYIATKAASEVISKIGFQIDPEGYITRRTGTIPNPNLELLFNGPKLKSFGLAFKLTPRSEDEAHQIRNIIKFFKKGMAPIRGVDQQSSFFLGTPNIFRVKFIPSKDSENEILSLPQFKTCALVRCEVDYTPDGIYSVYDDPRVGSQPIAVTLQLGFAELTPVYNNDYTFPDDEHNESVGPDRVEFEKAFYTKTTSQRQQKLASQEVPGTPSLTRRPGQPPILGGEGTAQRAGQQGYVQQWLDEFQTGKTTLKLEEWKRQKGYK